MIDEEMESSELGTLEYWQDRYKTEMRNFSSHGDTGEVWFGDDVVDRIINWIRSNIPQSQSIVDVGCGNGHILMELAQLGYESLTGLDYSDEAIQLAKAIAGQQGLQIKYQVNNAVEGLGSIYDVVHDKGTYDAISLSENSKDACHKYISSVKSALKENGHFLITSCNWTHSELEEQFKAFFALHTNIPTTQFKFGGKIGSVVSICVFKPSK
uniref:Protein-lysine N-methyltransferase n=1 Tax=Dendroctonus ponderosae TaxID=77166 RepID=J3JY21_DENPD|nr:unknown [Dendroctonus ponderosae]